MNSRQMSEFKIAEMLLQAHLQQRLFGGEGCLFIQNYSRSLPIAKAFPLAKSIRSQEHRSRLG